MQTVFVLSFDGPLRHWIADLAFAGATIGCTYLLIASLLVLRFSRGARDLAHVPLPVTFLKPLHGPEPRLFARLASFCQQRYAAPIQVICGTDRADDPSIEVVRRLASAFPEKEINLKIDSREHGSNRKISNLINMHALARHDVVIVADSDIQVGPNYLAHVIGALQQPGVGAVTCLYHGLAGAGLASRLSSLAINTRFLPEVVVALSLRLAQPCFGSTIAMRRQTLNQIDGFARFSEILAEDYAIGDAVRNQGYEVAIPTISVGHICFGFAGSIITHPLPLASIALCLGASDSVLLASVALGCRVLLCLSVERAFGLEWQHYWLIPVQDFVSFGVYVASFFGRTVNWRGHRYRVMPDGSLARNDMGGP